MMRSARESLWKRANELRIYMIHRRIAARWINPISRICRLLKGGEACF